MSARLSSSTARTLGLFAVAIAILALALSCHSGATSYILVEAPHPTTPAPPPVVRAGAGDSVVNARFRHVRFHMWPGVALQLDALTGRMHSTRADGVVSFDD